MRATLAALVLLLAASVPARADAGLEAAVAGVYGPRAHSDRLHAEAHERAIEITTDWSHNGQDCCWEVLAYNSGFSDPIAKAVDQWRNSPTHHGILADRSLTEIGCAELVTADGTRWFVCVLDDGPDPVPAPTPAPAPAPAPSPQTATNETPAPRTEPVVLPDTAMGR